MPDEEAPRDAPARFDTPETTPAESSETSEAPAAPLPGPVTADPGYTGPVTADPGYNDRGVPTFDSVREKIETRYGTAVGATELGSETAEARRVEQQYEARQKAAAERLEQIRKSMESTDDAGDP